jgi:hypothetical protein
MTDKQQQGFFLRFLALWLLLLLIAPIVAFCITRSPYCFAGFAPPTYLLTLLVRRLWPPSDNETKIAIAKHQRKAPP